MADQHNPLPGPPPTGTPATPTGPAGNGHAPGKPTSERVTTSPTAPAAIPAPAPRPGFWHWLWGSHKPIEKPTTPPQPADNTREIVETVVFVVVLVLLLKSFAAEAFVIPTGSMAETLWGYQKVVDCPKCKYQFPVNASQEADAQEDKTLMPVVGCICPNCLQPIAFTDTPKDYRNQYDAFKQEFPRAVDIPDPGWTSGDRVLVAKFLYELFGTLPNRLDVVVFKFPGESLGSNAWPRSGPHKNHVPMNYIKRLIGLPGEMIAIKGGKLYVLSAEKARELGLAFDDLAGLSGDQREQKRLELWHREYMHDDEGKTAFEAGHLFTIIKKPPEVVLSMRRIVYNNDHQPSDQLSGRERWPVTDEWPDAGGHGFAHKAGGDAWHWLRYRHLLPDRSKPRLISDVMGYNSSSPVQQTGHVLRKDSVESSNWVGDLLLECEAEIDKAEGELALELSRGADRFQAVWDLSNGRCSLWRIRDDKKDEKPLGSAETKVKKGTYRLRFANFDRRLTVWVDNRVVEWSGGVKGVDYEGASDLPTKNDLEPASLGATKASVRVRNLALWRDSYYTVDANTPDLTVAEGDWTDPGAWRNRKLPSKTYYVQPGHFLCMGDNSPQSSDGRSWGLVPERLLLGRAQLVYYPFYFPWWPLSSQVNRMQVIR